MHTHRVAAGGAVVAGAHEALERLVEVARRQVVQPQVIVPHPHLPRARRKAQACAPTVRLECLTAVYLSPMQNILPFTQLVLKLVVLC